MCVYIYIHIYIQWNLSHKKNKIIPFPATSINQRLSYWVKYIKLRKTNTIWYHLCVQSKTRVQMNFWWSRNKVTDIKSKLMIKRALGVRKIWINICTILYIKWISNKDLPYSTYNSTQYLLCNVTYGKINLKRVDKCICLMDSLCCKLRLAQHCKVTILQYFFKK